MRPHLELVLLPLGLALYESGSEQTHMYFPTNSIVSLLSVMENGSSAEIAVVGNEGVVGIALFMGGDTTPSRAVVQSAGKGYRLGANFLKGQFERGGSLQYLLLCYTQALITQMAQTAVCNRHHTVEQQLCRWLLLSMDRLPSNQLTMTQELISNMLGVRREGVTEAAGRLQSAGMINYNRGRITVLDRPMLEKRVCECYEVVKRESDRLLAPPIPGQEIPLQKLIESIARGTTPQVVISATRFAARCCNSDVERALSCSNTRRIVPTRIAWRDHHGQSRRLNWQGIRVVYSFVLENVRYSYEPSPARIQFEMLASIKKQKTRQGGRVSSLRTDPLERPSLASFNQSQQ